MRKLVVFASLALATSPVVAVWGQLLPTSPLLGAPAIVRLGTGTGSVVGGSSTNVASGTDATVFGFGNTASGSYSFAFGENNTSSSSYSLAFGIATTASGPGSTACGQMSTASGNAGFACGGGSLDRGRIGSWAWASSYDNTPGDSQTSINTLIGFTTSTASFRLTSDLNNAGSANVVNIPVNTAAFYSIIFTGKDHTTTGNASAVSGITGFLDCGATLGACVWSSTSTGTLTNHGTGLAANTSVSVAADTTNGGINLSVTPPNSHTWDWVALVTTTEVQ